MIRALRALGLDGTADERAIKRAYAVRLRACRPDEDPVAFQQLNEAYQEALAWARRRAERAAPSARGAAHEGSTPILTLRMEAPQWQPSMPERPPGDEAPEGQRPPSARLQVSPIDAPAGEDENEATRTAAKPRLTVTDTDAPADTPEDPQPPRRPRLTVTEAASPSAGNEDPPHRATETVAAPFVPPPFDPIALLADFLDEAINAQPAAFAVWMNAQPSLWSLRDKAMFGRTLMLHLGAEVPPISADNMEEIIGFFAIDDLRSGHDIRHVHELQRAMHEVWMAEQDLQRGTRIVLGRDGRGWPVYGREHGLARIGAATEERRMSALRRFARDECPELLGKWWWPSVFWRALSRARYERVAAALEGIDIDEMPGGFDRRAAKLWREAAESLVFSAGRVFVALSVTLGFCLILLIPLLALMIPSMSDGEPRMGVLLFPVGLTFSCFGLWLAVHLGRWLTLWQAGRDPASGLLRWLHLGLVPVLLLGTLALSAIGEDWPLRLLPLPYLVILALCRLHIRHGSSLPSFVYRLAEECDEWLVSSSYGPVLVLSSIVSAAIGAAVASSGGSITPIANALATLVACLWAWDLALSMLARRRPT